MQFSALVESFENFSKMQNSSNHHLVHSFANDPQMVLESCNFHKLRITICQINVIDLIFHLM